MMGVGIGAFVATVLLWLFRRSVRGVTAAEVGEPRVLRYHWGISALGAVAVVLLPLLLSITLLTSDEVPNKKELWGGGIVSSLAALLGSWLYVVASRTEYTWSDDGLCLKSPFRTGREVRWEDVARISYLAKSASFDIATSSGESVPLSVHLMGLPVLLRFLSARCGALFDEEARRFAKPYID